MDCASCFDVSVESSDAWSDDLLEQLALHCSNFAANSVPAMHHFVKDFLLCWVSIRLIFFADGYTFTGIVTDTKEISTSIISIIRLRMI